MLTQPSSQIDRQQQSHLPSNISILNLSMSPIQHINILRAPFFLNTIASKKPIRLTASIKSRWKRKNK